MKRAIAFHFHSPYEAACKSLVLMIWGFVMALFFTTSGGCAETAKGMCSPKPFYIIGHYPDNLEEARAFLREGANALEPDVNVYAGRTNELCIAHGPVLWTGGGSDASPSLRDFLLGLHELAREYPTFSLVYFDCKPLVRSPKHGKEILQAIRDYLIQDGTNKVDLKIIISVANLKSGSIFSEIAKDLRSTEGIMIDQEKDVTGVSAFLTGTGATNKCFSNGISVANKLIGWTKRPSVREACKIREKDHRFSFVTTWTVNNRTSLKKYLAVGVNGMIVDSSGNWYNPGKGLSNLKRLIELEGDRYGVRLANRQDNPFVMNHSE